MMRMGCGNGLAVGSVVVDKDVWVKTFVHQFLNFTGLVGRGRGVSAVHYKADIVEARGFEVFNRAVPLRLGTGGEDDDWVAFALDVVDDPLHGLARVKDGAVDVGNDDFGHKITSS